MKKKTLAVIFIFLILVSSGYFSIKYYQKTHEHDWFYSQDSSWMGIAEKRIQNIRTGNFTLIFPNNNNSSPILIKIEQLSHEYKFGATIPFFMFVPEYEKKYPNELNSLRKTMLELFNWFVPEDNFKWTWTEPAQNVLNFSAYNESVNWVKMNNKNIRSHCLFWANELYNPQWARKLDNESFKDAIFNRINYTADLYGSQITSLDVINEMLYHSYYRDRLGNSIIKDIYKTAKEKFPNADLYLNEYLGPDPTGKSYVEMANEFAKDNVSFTKIGLQTHWTEKDFRNANAQMLEINKTLDVLASLGKKILLSEFDFESTDPEFRADFLEQFFTLCFAHPATEGIMLWWWIELEDHFPDRGLVNIDGSLNIVGERFKKLVFDRWWTNITTELTPDFDEINCTFNFRAFYGNYKISIIQNNTIKTYFISLNHYNQTNIELNH